MEFLLRSCLSPLIRRCISLSCLYYTLTDLTSLNYCSLSGWHLKFFGMNFQQKSNPSELVIYMHFGIYLKCRVIGNNWLGHNRGVWEGVAISNDTILLELNFLCWRWFCFYMQKEKLASAEPCIFNWHWSLFVAIFCVRFKFASLKLLKSFDEYLGKRTGHEEA